MGYAVPEDIGGVRRQYRVSVDEVLDRTHGHDHEVRGRIGVVARQQEGPEKVLHARHHITSHGMARDGVRGITTNKTMQYNTTQ